MKLCALVFRELLVLAATVLRRPRARWGDSNSVNKFESLPLGALK